MEIGFLGSAKVTVLVENTVYKRDLLAEHGLSLFIEVVTEKDDKFMFLFDVGQTAVPIINNVRSLEIPLEKNEYIVISHGHYDHTGGLTAVLEHIPHTVKVIGHEYMFEDKIYREKSGKIRKIGVPFKKEDFDKMNARFIPIREPMVLTEGVGLITEIPVRYSFEINPKFITVLKNGKEVPTHIEDIALILNLKKRGALVITGCGHAGILNTIYYAKEVFNLKRIYGIMGGFHMINANKRRIDITISELEKNEISVIYPMHCTGPDAIRALKDKYRKGKVVDSSVGSVIEYK